MPIAGIIVQRLLELIFGVVAGIDEQLLHIFARAGNRLAEEAGDDARAVVIGLGIVDGGLAALHQSVDHLNDLGSQGTGVLEDGHGLLAGEHVDPYSC